MKIKGKKVHVPLTIGTFYRLICADKEQFKARLFTNFVLIYMLSEYKFINDSG